MNLLRSVKWPLLAWCMAGVLTGTAYAQAQAQQEEFTPVVGQPGKDVVWVPTPQVVVDSMLDMARVTANDVVVDLGSGDGRMIISAAKRGARSRGVEYNPDMVELSRRSAEEEGVGARATFVQGDMFEADFSDATVLSLFLLPANLDKLKDKFLALKPGTRIAANTFWISGWEPDEASQLPEEICTEWCRIMLFIVPARVAGTWRLPQGELKLSQEYQKLSGTLSQGGNVTQVADGRLRGDEITFTVGTSKYTGRVNGNRIEGTVAPGGTWTATRSN